MILNAYAILAGSIGLLRLLLSLGLGFQSWAAWRRWRSATQPEQRTAVEDRSYLLLLQALFLGGLNVASWPLFYLVLQSYVPQWPDVMCVYGVTRVGLGSEGPSRFLPGLLIALQWLKPALVFLTGAWLALYAVHRRSETSWLLRSMLALLVILGVAGALDASAEAAYLVIPKRNEFLSSGCCTVRPDLLARGASGAPTPGQSAALTVIFYLGSLALIPASLAFGGRGVAPGPLLAGAVAVTAAGGAVLTHVIAPRVLGNPGHHCAFDLIPRAPDVILGAVLFTVATFNVGWAVVVSRLPRPVGSPDAAPAVVRGLLGAAGGAYVAALVLLSWRLLIARG